MKNSQKPQPSSARAVTTYSTLPPQNPLTILSAIKKQIYNITKKGTKAWWKRSKRSSPSTHLSPPENSPGPPPVSVERKTSLLTQLCTDHMPLIGHLFRFKRQRHPTALSKHHGERKIPLIPLLRVSNTKTQICHSGLFQKVPLRPVSHLAPLTILSPFSKALTKNAR